MKKLFYLALICGAMTLSSFSVAETLQIPESECFDRADAAATAYGNVYNLDYYNEYLYFIDYYEMCIQWAND